MAFIGLKVPHEVARLLSEVVSSGEPVSPDTFHITVAMLGDQIPIEDMARAIGPVFSVASDTRPFTVSTNHISAFPPAQGKNTVPIIALIDSFELHAMRARLTAALDTNKIEYSKKFPEYRPHVTLAHSKDLMAVDAAEQHLPSPLVWGAQELVLWGGDKGDNRVVVTFPFSLGIKTAAADYRAEATRGHVRLAMLAGRHPTWPRRDAVSKRVAERFGRMHEGR